ncbi:MAG: hypothetical protein WD794_15870 [Mycobacteriales bacterium]
MPASPHDRLRRHYKALGAGYETTDRRADYGRLVVPNGNAEEPFHRWFHLKEAFSSKLLGRVVKDDPDLAAKDVLLLLDPFAGGGTTLLAGLLGSPGWSGTATGVGVERNPFLRLVAATKVAAAVCDGDATAAKLRSAAARVLRKAPDAAALPLPDLVTLRTAGHYPSGAVEELLRLRAAAETLRPGLARDLVLLCVATSLEPAGYLRRDGRALRYDPDRKPVAPREAFAARLAVVLEDLNGRPARRTSARVVDGDARVLTGCEDARGFDLALFSPPYPNNIDYTEVYKTEAWLLGMYEDAKAFRAQRLTTLRSHPSIAFPETYGDASSADEAAVERLVAPLLAVVPTDRYTAGRTRMIRGYVEDMHAVFRRCAELANASSRLVFVVGNSAHGSGDDRFEVAADLLLCRAAELVGWRVEEIGVARDLSRRGRGSNLLRESAVRLRLA